RKAVEGVIEVDKALIGYARDAVTGYVELGKESVQAKSMNDLLDLHVARAHSRIETTAANTREILELTRQKAGEAYAPVKEVFQTSQSTDAA
ncbi:MAG: phasin family protein, partial [Pseudomonadota bacterium]